MVLVERTPFKAEDSQERDVMTMSSLRNTLMGLLALLIAAATAGGPAWSAEKASRVQLSAVDAHRTIDTLNLKSLKKGLRATEAVGTFTKLALKTRYDALIGDFREFHRAKSGNLDALRGRFEELLGETLDLLRAGDPPLFRRLSRAQAGLWRLLSDPVEFSAADRAPVVLVKRQSR
jgi:hypothetical protein